MERTLDLWLPEPVFVAGLGRYFAIQQAEDNGRLIVIHNTGLWLLVETGIVRVAVFIGAFTTILIGVWRRARRTAIPNNRAFHQNALIFLLGFAVMSLGHDLLYQKILCLVLAVPRPDRLP
jgi:O-antigen ligase